MEYTLDYKFFTNQYCEPMIPISYNIESCKPSKSIGPIIHNTWQIHYVYSGKGDFILDGIAHHIKAGQIFITPPYTKCSYIADAIHPWKCIWVGIKTKKLPDVFDSPVITCPEVGYIFNKMQECLSMDYGDSAFISACLWELVSIISVSKKATNFDSFNYVKSALDFMKLHYRDHITVQNVADFLNLNRSYFSDIFRKEMHITPSQYLISLRLNKAAELMTTLQVSPTIAANSVAYDDFSHFSKSFKSKFGVSPREYLKANSTNNTISDE